MIRYNLYGLPISIEVPKGKYRSGKAPDGTEWIRKMPCDYGYIRRTQGSDGEHIDCMVGSDKNSELVYIANNGKGKRFDEHKVFIAFPSENEAKRIYKEIYEDTPINLISFEPLTIKQFKHWLRVGSKTKAMKISSIRFKALVQDRINKREQLLLKAGFKYIRKIPTGNPKRPFIYIYKEDSPAKRKEKIALARKLRKEAANKGPVKNTIEETSLVEIVDKVVDSIKNFFGFGKKI